MSGSSAFAGGGIWSKFRGKIWDQGVNKLSFQRCNVIKELTPGSVTDAWISEEIQMKEMYAKIMGIAAEAFCQNHGALFQG